MVALMPHGYCFLWNKWLTSFHVIGDGVISVAYLSIPAMMYLNRDRATETMRPLLLMFAAFIFSCGVGHGLSAWNVWHGDYWIEGVWKLVIASISLATAWLLKNQISDLMSIHQQLSETERLANTDRLTDLLNRRGFEQALQQLPAITARSASTEHVLILIDLDHFKGINDTYGHAVGDRLLQNTAQIITNYIRSVDFAARLGGDEFAVLLVGCSLARGRHIANRIRSKIAELTLEATSGEPQQTSLVTASIGLQLLKGNAPFSYDELFQQADVLLYKSKRRGRNQVTTSATAQSS